MADDESILRNPICSRTLRRRLCEVFQAHTGGYHLDGCDDTALLQQSLNAFAGGEHLVAEIGVTGREFNRKPFQGGESPGI